MSLVQLAELQEESVELRIRDLRLVEDVVEVLVPADLAPQLVQSPLDVAESLAGHRFSSGARAPLMVLRPAVSKWMISSSSVRVRVLLITVPRPNLGCATRSPS